MKLNPGVAGLLLLLAGTAASQAQALPGPAVRSLQVVGDSIPQPLTDTPGDPSRGRAIVTNRQQGLCLLCHSGPFPEERFQGNLAPDLSGAGLRWTRGQLRLRIADARALYPDSVMPAYHRADGLVRVPAALAGVPLLGAQQVEDVVAFLETLRP